MEFSKSYYILQVADLAKVNFAELLNTSFEDCVKSVDETLFVASTNLEQLTFLEELSDHEGPLTREQALVVLSSEAWIADELVKG